MAVTKSQLIERMRQRVFQLTQDDSAREFDQIDLEAIATGSDLLWRFALFQLENDTSVVDKSDLNKVNIDRAVEMLLATLKWRKDYGIHEIKDSDIPREFYQLKMFTYAMHHDKRRIFLFIRVSKYKNISSSIRSLIIKGIVHEIEKKISFFANKYENGVCDLKPVIILDCAGIKYHSIDINLLTEMVTIVSNHFPQVVDQFWVYDLPWMAGYLFPLFVKAIPSVFARRIKKVYFDDAVASVGIDCLPGFMGGTSQVEPVLEIPPTAGSLEELARKKSLDKSDVKKFIEHLNSVQPSF